MNKPAKNNATTAMATPMAWSQPKDLKAQLLRLWERGDLLRDAIAGTTRFPLRLALKTPASADITDRFDAVRRWAAELSAAPHFRLELQAVRHRIQGLQQLPTCAWIDSNTQALIWLGKRHEWDNFMTLLSATQQSHPALLPWLAKRPLQALKLADDWAQLLAVVDWLLAHPRPGIYLRQVDLPGVHSKFIENHRSVLAELLDLTLPASAIDAAQTGVNQFTRRYGFLEKPSHIRLRVLDPRIQPLPGLDCPDLMLDAHSFSRLQLSVKRVFITENEINFLAFPQVPHAIAIFGAGYGWEALSRSLWLNACAVYYWGDIDTHGFAILHQLRTHFAHAESFLMDRATLNAHTALWGIEDKPQAIDLPKLSPDEYALYNDLRDNRIRKNLRLEQEHISFGWLRSCLNQLNCRCSSCSEYTSS